MTRIVGGVAGGRRLRVPKNGTRPTSDQTREALCGGPGGGVAAGFTINWVWMPPWGPDKITDDGREQLRALGFNV